MSDWQIQLLRGRHRKLRQVPPVHLLRGVLPDGTRRPGVSTYPRAKMDRGLLNVAVLAYSKVRGIGYEDAHKKLREGSEESEVGAGQAGSRQQGPESQ